MRFTGSRLASPYRFFLRIVNLAQLRKKSLAVAFPLAYSYHTMAKKNETQQTVKPIKPRERYEQVIAKGVRDAAFVRANLDLAQSVADHFEALINRYLKNYRSPNVPAELGSCYVAVSPGMLMYGLFTHFICFGSDNRVRFQQVDQQHLYNRWEEMAVKALSTFDEYSKENQGVPDALFQELYALDVEPTVSNSGVWLWKRVRVKSTIRDRFATGVVLGMAVDMATASL